MKICITGGAGFIGSNAVRFFASKSHEVVVLDNLSRVGGDNNLQGLKSDGVEFAFVNCDMRNQKQLADALGSFRPDLILHLAGQVAVTTSITNPFFDFENNVVTTVNLLEVMGASCPNAFLIYASTNKVYGELEKFSLAEGELRYSVDALEHGVSEDTALDFRTPYGCSKGAADQYVLEYARSLGIKATVFRQSCIYGPNQYGIEDQGWIAWFAIASMFGHRITIFGNGKQVRDVLYVDDLLNAYELAWLNQDEASGRAFNIGGGPAFTLSVLELIQTIEKSYEIVLDPNWQSRRPNDQRVYVSDIRRAKDLLGWEPSIDFDYGFELLRKWLDNNKLAIGSALSK